MNYLNLSFSFVLLFLFQQNFSSASINMQMQTNEAFNVQFSHKAGFYDTPFQVSLSSPENRFMILYTLDGSNPLTSKTTILSKSPATVLVDPESNSGRAVTPGFIIRACLWQNGAFMSNPTTQTYIFSEKVKHQKWPGGNWPSKDINGQRLDYDIAADVVSHKDYSHLLDSALKQIPTISLVTDLPNLFDAVTGIYVNATKKGDDWERDCSVELIYPNGEQGFQVNAGMRIRGGNSAKKPENPKRGFRLFFRQKYGAAKLEYPLFGTEGAKSFDCIDLRCEQNYSWNMDGNLPNSMVKDIFCRDIQGMMGHPFEHGDYCHLYLNGMYWGLYQTDERPEASFAATYIGGDKADYDVIKVNTQPWPYYNETTDGTMDSWEKLWNLCQKGFTTNKNYFFLEGKNELGIPIPGGEVLVDIDNLIDYMLLIFYTGNFDAPVSAWYGDDMPNNFFAIFNRTDKRQGYKFVAHDSEHCMFVQNLFGRKGINENRVNIGSNGSMRINRVLEFNPQWLHYKLTSNAEYRLRFADRAARLLSGSGLLVPEKTATQFQKRANQIDLAVIAESARWGDAQNPFSLTRNEHWLPEIQSMMKNYFPYRTNIVINQLKNEKIYSSIPMPIINMNGNKIEEERILFTGSQSIDFENPGTTGSVYFTLDGTDPRTLGGGISLSAKISQPKVAHNVASTTKVKARIKTTNEWGPLIQVVFSLKNQTFDALKITELHYHPSDTIMGTDTLTDEKLEFIELKNTGSQWLDLSGITFTSGIAYKFPENTLLAPGEFYVIAAKPNSFYLRYGIYPSGNYSQQLGNEGEMITMTDSGGADFLSFTYSDKAPWPTESDGYGYSLTATENNPTENPNIPAYWMKSTVQGGSPFANDNSIPDALHQETVDKYTVTVFPNPASEFINISIPQTTSNTRVVFYSIDGKKVASFNIKKSKGIHLASYGITKGIYILTIESETGRQNIRLAVTGN